MTLLTRSEVEKKVIVVLNDMTDDWDLDLSDGIGPQTLLLSDLGFESVDVVQLAVALEQAMGREGLPFEKLFMKDGDYVDDLRVQEVVDFLDCELNPR